MTGFHSYRVVIAEPSPNSKGFTLSNRVYEDESPSKAAYHIARENGYIGKETFQGETFNYIAEVSSDRVQDFDYIFRDKAVKMAISIKTMRGTVKTFTVTH